MVNFNQTYSTEMLPHLNTKIHLIKHMGELPCVLPYAVHLDLGYCPDTQGYFELLSGPYTPSHTL